MLSFHHIQGNKGRTGLHSDDSIDQCTCSSLLELSLLAGINRQWKLGAPSIKSLKLSRFSRLIY